MTDSLTFRTTIELGGRTATGLHVPDEVVSALGPGRRPAVRVTIGQHTYRTTVASMGGRFMIPLSAPNRAAADVAAGDEVDVTIEADTATREVAVPDDLRAALAADRATRDFFDALAYTHRKEWVRWIEDAKRPDTRAKRVPATVCALDARKRSR
jgi:Bacteriocin-protection, YdeI or OmpD-Associated/Domain of unknown function (DUF1905)